MVPRSAPKAISEAMKSNGRWIRRAFGTIWAILGAILGPVGRQGAHKIELFGTKSHQNLKKWGPEWGSKKYVKFWSKFNEKMWDFGCAEPTEMLCIKAFWWLAHIMTKSRISWKSMPKWTPKVIPKSTFGRSGVRLLRFLAVFWGMRFLMSFGMCKKSIKNDKSSTIGRQKAVWTVILGRVGGRGGRPGKGFGKFWDKFWELGLTRLAPPSKDGVGGFKGRAPAADPGFFVHGSISCIRWICWKNVNKSR